MNHVALIGRLVRDPDVKYTTKENSICIANYTLAVDRRFKRSGDQEADFIQCVAMGKSGEFAEKYLRKGIKIAVEGRIQTGSYTNNDGQTVYTFKVFVENHEFCESKNSNGQQQTKQYSQPAPSPQPAQQQYSQQSMRGYSAGDDFMSIPTDMDDLPFG